MMWVGPCTVYSLGLSRSVPVKKKKKKKKVILWLAQVTAAWHWERILQAVGSVVSAALMATQMEPYIPRWAVFLFVLLAGCLGVALVGFTMKVVRDRKAKGEPHTVLSIPPNGVTFTNSRLRLASLVRPDNQFIERARFEKCLIMGPQVVVVCDTTEFKRCSTNSPHQAFLRWFKNEKHPSGAVYFLKCEFVDCVFWNITFADTADEIKRLAKCMLWEREDLEAAGFIKTAEKWPPKSDPEEV